MYPKNQTKKNMKQTFLKNIKKTQFPTIELVKIDLISKKLKIEFYTFD